MYLQLSKSGETNRTIAESDMHANHAEAFFSALRRKCATFRRKTNMYAKSTTGLQRLLHVYWVVHNFLRAHFTTREVPAVALGVLYASRLVLRHIHTLGGSNPRLRYDSTPRLPQSLFESI
jgi:hypothetical protein